MEIVLLGLFIVIMIVVSLLKNRLPERIRTATSLIASAALLVWFWGFMDGPIRWKILVSVVVAVSLLMLLLMKKKPAADNPAE
jgi:preprotein translocase subunit SecG